MNQTLSSNNFQVAIIGGGLAGLCLSIQLAEQGYSVVLIEKEKYPFHKVCGEYIAMESWNFLEQLGVPLSQMNLPRINKLHVSACNGNLLKHNLNPGGFGISRFTLDHKLAQIATQKGVALLDETKVNAVLPEYTSFLLKTSKGEIRAGLVCGAHGKRSNIDVKLKRKFIQNPDPNNYIAIKYHVKADLSENLIALHNFENGYCGISKVDSGRFCLCYLTTVENLQKHSGYIKHMEKAILMKNPHLADCFTQSEFLYEQPLAISQLNFSSKASVENHIFMLGDAAGLITPLCGNGMSMAMHASKLLACILPELIESKISLQLAEERYLKLWNQQFSTRLKVGRTFQYLFGHPTVTNLTIALLKHTPGLMGKLVNLTHGENF
ncbi:NAD(P)/FAD-dependent oxidoreductase [Solitalea koreensis]|uniref:Dehydrogenase (Flavoprotein) n=1 Tax=Solitalea koreensis TaxID=543615 RepID=A0A521AS44_9SPHI|nr:NAD(P)/FAD-dependent oxidoreductase [Solitalea koreensis]SMO37648.1 Dehydrogenase (flavoprotein) [Solitalea koreensis]